MISNRMGHSPVSISFQGMGGGGFGGAPPMNGVQNPFDSTGVSPEARAAGGAQGGVQQLTSALTEGLTRVMSAKSPQESQQAIQSLRSTYQQGQKSGLLNRVDPMLRSLVDMVLQGAGGNQAAQNGMGGAGGGGGAQEAGGGG